MLKPAPTPGDTTWFTHDRFGMFIHWGLYALPARGTFDQRALDALSVYGDWLKLHARAIYGCTQSEFTPSGDYCYIQNGNRLYVHIYTWPFKALHLDGLADKIT